MDLGLAGKKALLRRDLLRRRDNLREDFRREASQEACARLRKLISLKAGESLGAYLPIRSEIDPRPLLTRLACQGIAVSTPAIVGNELEFREFHPDAELVSQGFGILAAGVGARVLKPAVFIVPLVAFDRSGHRLGYGKGYYDRAIARADTLELPPIFIGFAFSEQEIESVPVELHDKPLDIIVTEREVIRSASVRT